jgi:thioredoxin:protein disulfide reductase
MHIFRKLWLLLICCTAGLAHAADAFLEPEIAFPLRVTAPDAQHLSVQFGVAPGYHLYRDQLSASTDPALVFNAALPLPPGQIEFDATFNKNVEIYKTPISVTLPLAQQPSAPFKFTVFNQGCADQGLCYAPMERSYRVEPLGGQLQISPLSEAQAALWTAPPAATVAASVALPVSSASAAPTAAAPTGFVSALQSGSWAAVVGAFFLAGLVLSFTPCVLPMIPILSSIIVGQGSAVSRGKGLGLAAAYALGMALVYSALGMAAGLAGEGLAAALQNAWVLGAFALLLSVLALSMFGVYALQMPSSVQTRLSQWSGRMQGGQYLGVFAMGGASALIVGPCVAAPLAGALVYISQTRNVMLGGTALFAMACGMSVPLLLVGLSAGALLPRAGAWMERVKHGFGWMLLAVALWMVAPVLPAQGLMLGTSILLMGLAVYVGAFARLPDPITPARALIQSIGLILALCAAAQLVGALSGGTQLLQPLQPARVASVTGAGSSDSAHLKWRTVADLAALEAAVQASPQPVLVDFYADWCVACKELEVLTFSQAAVRQRLARFTLLRVDVTANSAQDKALLRKFQLFGPPAMLFFAPHGAEISSARVIGFQSAEVFSSGLDAVLGAARQ